MLKEEKSSPPAMNRGHLEPKDRVLPMSYNVWEQAGGDKYKKQSLLTRHNMHRREAIYIMVQ